MIAHACPKCGTSTSRKGRCTTCARPESRRKRALPNHHQVYSTKRWRELRQRILKRDAHTCQVCGKPGTTVGHRRPFNGAADPLAWAETNLQVECLRCGGREAGKRLAASRQPATT